MSDTPRQKAPGRARRSQGAQRERDEHEALAQALRELQTQYPALAFCYHCANESTGVGPIVKRTNRRTGKTYSVPLDVLINARRGVVAGVWDWQLLYPNVRAVDGRNPAGWRGIAIELKTDEGELEPEQLRWQAHYLQNGWQTRIFRRWYLAAAYLVRWVGGDPRSHNLPEGEGVTSW